MRVGIVGGGLAGSLLAWRLAGQSAVATVLLAPGAPAAADATGASGGAVRAYELNPEQRALALASMAELADDPVLRNWSGFVDCGSVYLPAEPTALAEAAEEINDTLGESASVVDAAELAAAGWAGLAEDRIGIRERLAGYLDPDRFRRSLLADLAGRKRVSVLPARPVESFSAAGFLLDGDRYDCDLLVLAAGAWTPGLLTAAGYPASGLITKSIQYTIHRATGMPATTFVDDASGLFGKPHPGGLLLGLPTTGWGAPASGVPADPRLPTAPRRWRPRPSPRCGCTRPSRRWPRSTAMPNPAYWRCVRYPAGAAGCSRSPAVAAARPRLRWPPAGRPPPACLPQRPSGRTRYRLPAEPPAEADRSQDQNRRDAVGND